MTDCLGLMMSDTPTYFELLRRLLFGSLCYFGFCILVFSGPPLPQCRCRPPINHSQTQRNPF